MSARDRLAGQLGDGSDDDALVSVRVGDLRAVLSTVDATRERTISAERDAAQLALADLRCAVEVTLRALGESPPLPRDPVAFVPFFDDAAKIRAYLRAALDATRGKR